jgi:hypothetical protein
MSPIAPLWDFLNLPIAEAVETFYHGKSAARIAEFAPAESTRKLDVSPPMAILPNRHYLTVTSQKTVLAFDRVLVETFYPVAHSTVVLLDGMGDPRTLTSFQTLSPDLLKLDEKAGRKLVQGPRTLLDCVPFRGSVIGSTIALIAVEAADYSKPFLSTLQKLSDIAGVKYFALAAAFAEPLILGIQGLSQAGGGVQIAYAGNLPLRTGVFLIASIDRLGFDWSQYTFAPDYSLLRNGAPVTSESYMVVTIEVSTERHAWRQIPELRAASAALDDAVKAAQGKIFDAASDERKKVEAALTNLQWQCLSTPELCTGDGESIAIACKENVVNFMRIAGSGLSEGRGTESKKKPGFSLEDIHPAPRPAA